MRNHVANLESVAFVAACYDQKCEGHETMTDICHKVWVSKAGVCIHCIDPFNIVNIIVMFILQLLVCHNCCPFMTFIRTRYGNMK